MKKTGSKNVLASSEAIKTIESLVDNFKRKRISRDEFILRVNQCMASMTSERDYIEYLVNIGQY